MSLRYVFHTLPLVFWVCVINGQHGKVEFKAIAHQLGTKSTGTESESLDYAPRQGKNLF